MLHQTRKLVESLRVLNKGVLNAPKIDQWVEKYLDGANGKSVTLITPWSLSFRFLERYKLQGNSFSPTQKEIKLFQKEIPRVADLFKEAGLSVDWWISFSRGYLEDRRLPSEIEISYIEMIESLNEEHGLTTVINWEDDVLRQRHFPAQKVIDKFEEFVPKGSFEAELARWERWIKEEKIETSHETLVSQTKYQIACEANEGQFLMENPNNPLSPPGEFLFVILGGGERYNFFSTLAPEFSKRILAILQPYPWRL